MCAESNQNPPPASASGAPGPSAPGGIYARPAAPPTSPGALEARRPAWPTVIGVIGIVLGALGALSAIWAAVAPKVMGDMLSTMSTAGMPGGAEMMQTSQEIAQRWRAWTVASTAGEAIVAVSLIVAASGLVRRRRWAHPAMIAWGVLRMLAALVGAIVTYQIQVGMFEAMARFQSAPAMPPGFANIMSVIGMIIVLLWGWAPPIFIFIWFARAKVRAEIAQWR